MYISALHFGLDRGTPDPTLYGQCKKLYLRREDFHVYQGMKDSFQPIWARSSTYLAEP